MPNAKQSRVIDPILTTVVQGYIHPEHIGHHLFPNVFVPAAGGQVIEFGKEAFKEYNTQRSPGTNFKRIRFGYLGKPYAVENHGVEALVPREIMRDASVVPGIDMATRAVNNVLRVNSLTLEKQRADLARDDTQYDANHKLTLTGTDRWNDFANSKPIQDIKAAKEAIRSTIGVYPNVIQIPAAVMVSLTEHPDILDKIKYTQAGVVTAELLARLFEVDKVVVGKAMGFDANNNPSDYWGKDVILAYVPTTSMGAEEPSYGYTYTLENHPNVEVPYWDNQVKSWVYGVAHERIAVTSGITSGFVLKTVVD